MKEIVEEMEKKLENKNINLSGWGFSFSGLAFAFYAQGSGFSPQLHEKKDFGTCQHSEGRGRTVSSRPTTSSCWAGGWIEKKKANLILILFLKHLVLFTLKGLHTKELGRFRPFLDSVPVRTGKGIYV